MCWCQLMHEGKARPRGRAAVFSRHWYEDKCWAHGAQVQSRSNSSLGHLYTSSGVILAREVSSPLPVRKETCSWSQGTYNVEPGESQGVWSRGLALSPRAQTAALKEQCKPKSLKVLFLQITPDEHQSFHL